MVQHSVQNISLLNHIIRTLAYFDYFNFPLRIEQIIFYLGTANRDQESIQEALDYLVDIGKVKTKQGFYGLKDIDSNVERKLAGEHLFEQLQERIQKSCKRISYFPFVKFIGLSGSMSKGYATADADIDFFIVTDKNRLWICKILLHMLKMLSMIKGSQRWYCLNYYVDITAMRIEDQNPFTAVELASLKPLIDEANYYEQLIADNKDWLYEAMPNFTLHDKQHTIRPQSNIFSRTVRALSTDWLNRWVMHLTDGNWRKRKKRSQIPADQYHVVIKTRENISKRHYRNFQKRMLDHQNRTEALLIKEI